MRLIDADALEKFLQRLRRELPKESRDFFTRDEMILNFQQYVHMQPTIDAVPVVRCNECKHYSAPVVARDTGLCLWADRDELAAPDGYCSHGATKESIK